MTTREDVDEADAEARVLAIDNVPLDLPVAGAGSRTLAALCDYIIITAVDIGLVVVLVVLGHLLHALSAWWVAVIIFGVFAVEYGYFSLCEIFMAGQTPGKRAVGLRVVTRAGGRPAATSILVRNTVRSLDVVVGVPMMAFDPLARRLGDRLAGTLVTRTERATMAMVRRVPRGWSARRIEVLEAFVARADEMAAPRAEAMARALIAAIQADDPAFLDPESAGQDPVARLKRSVRG